MTTCHDPRHDEPCPDAQNCSACMDECSTEYWLEPDGTPWGDVALILTPTQPEGH